MKAFDSIEQNVFTTSSFDKSAKVNELHKGFKTDLKLFRGFYYKISEISSKGIAGVLNWNEVEITQEMTPQLFDSAKIMLEGEEVDGRQTLGLIEINNWKINESCKESNIRKHAGYAAELISTWKENAQALKNETGIKTYRVDDLSDDLKKVAREQGDSFQKNDPYVDKIRVNEQGEIVERIQTKFVGGDAKGCLQKLLSTKYDKYFLEDKVDSVEIPKDFYSDVKNLVVEKISSLEKQIAYLKMAEGKEDVLENKLAQLDRLKKVDEKIIQSSVTYDEARYAVEQPRLYTSKIFANELKTSEFTNEIEDQNVDTTDEILKLDTGDITKNEIALGIMKDLEMEELDVNEANLVGQSVANGMKSSSHELFGKLGEVGLSAEVVELAIEAIDLINEYMQGEISTKEFIYELVEIAVEELGEEAGKQAALFIAKLIIQKTFLKDIPGSAEVVEKGFELIGAIIGCVLASEAYKTAVEQGGESAEAMAAKAQELADKAIAIATEEMPEKVDYIREAINKFATENNIPVTV